ncbi:MAG: extracellular solute-binding protein [Chloroflexota bacterium]
MRRSIFFVVFALLALVIVPVAAQDDAEEDPGVVNVYSSRHYGQMESPFVAFEEATGIEVRVADGSPRDLLTRLEADIARGGRSVADVFLAIDAGVLDLAAERGLLTPLSEDEYPDIYANVAEGFRDPDGHWFGLSIRTRTAVYNPENVTEEELAGLNTYSDLANPVWEGRLCMRPASHIYTVSVFSSLLYHLGEEEALAVADGIANNVTRYINSDTSQIQAVAAGECDVALVNHYYLGGLAASEDPADQETFSAVEIKWMNQGTEEEPGTGVFFNVNGAGVVVNAANFDNAVRFIEFMSSLEGQGGEAAGFPGSNFEFPTNPEAEPNPFIAAFGEFEYDLGYPLWEYGNLQSDTVALLEEAEFGFAEN